MKAKIHLARGGAAAMEAVAKGEVEIGLTFVSEILTEPGVEAVGPLPAAISTPTSLVAFVSSHARSATAARALVRYLSSPDAAATYKKVGMEPAKQIVSASATGGATMLAMFKTVIAPVIVVLGALGVGGVFGAAAQAPSPKKAEPPKVMRLYVFDCGLLNIAPAGVARYHVTPAETGETRMPVPCFLVAHPKGTLMWDVGVIPDETVESDGVQRRRALRRQPRVAPRWSRAR